MSLQKERSGFELDNGTRGVSASASLQKESVSEKLVKRDSEELRKNGEQLKATRLQKESEWEKELEEHINWLVTAQFMENPYKFEKESTLVTRKKQEIIELFSQAIATAVANRENEIAYEVEKIKLPVPNPYGKWVKIERVNMLLDKAIQITKH